jgi:hypothetical protein
VQRIRAGGEALDLDQATACQWRSAEAKPFEMLVSTPSGDRPMSAKIGRSVVRQNAP